MSEKSLEKKSFGVAVIIAILMIVIGILAYIIAVANTTKDKAQLEELSNEEISVPSENTFDLIF